MFKCILDPDDVQLEDMAQMTGDMERVENMIRNQKTQMGTGFGHPQMSQGTGEPQEEAVHPEGSILRGELMKEEARKKDIIWMIPKS